MVNIQLVERNIGDNVVQTIDARELHSFLEVGKDYTTWIKDRIEKYDLIIGVDYFPILGNASIEGRTKDLYVLTIDCAKELSMSENNEKGKEARKYFIECEKKLKAMIKPLSLQEMTSRNFLILIK